MVHHLEMAQAMLERCRELAGFTEEPGYITRTFLSEPMRQVHARLRVWMEQAGMRTSVDAAGNLRGSYAGREPDSPCLYIGSHLDTVPRAGAFDGPLGVLLGVALVEALGGYRLGFRIEVVGFSEEEGVRFGIPFIGSRAVVGDVGEDLLAARDSKGTSVSDAIRDFGLDPAGLPLAQVADGAIGFLEFHIEQGPVLEEMNLPVALVESIAGQSRLALAFRGKANHAGATPMGMRRDALAGAAEWVLAVEKAARSTPDLRATVGRLEVLPGAINVIPGEVRVSLDARHACDAVRAAAVEAMLATAREIAVRRALAVSLESRFDQPVVTLDSDLTGRLEHALQTCDLPVHRMTSGAGHDAMILARRMPAAMLFLRSPGGVSHHPDESVLAEDVATALVVGRAFIRELEISRG